MLIRQKRLIISPLKEEHIEVEGVIATVLAGTMFRVELDNKHIVLATLSALAREKKIEAKVVQQAIKELGINPEKANPAVS